MKILFYTGLVRMNNLPDELMLETVLTMKYQDIENLCKTNKSYREFCKQNENYIFKKLIERDHSCIDSSSYKELYYYILNPENIQLALCKKKYCDTDQNIMKIIALYIKKATSSILPSERTKYIIDMFDIVVSCKTKLLPKELLKSFINKIKDTKLGDNNKYYEEWNSKRDSWLKKLNKHLET